MREETKKLIHLKTFGDDKIHARDIRGIIDTETELLQNTIKKLKVSVEQLTTENARLVSIKRNLENELSSVRAKDLANLNTNLKEF